MPELHTRPHPTTLPDPPRPAGGNPILRGRVKGRAPVLPWLLCLALLVAALGCATGGGGTDGGPDGHGQAAAPPSHDLDCGSVAKLPRILEPGTVVLFGEIHGTREVPEFFADVVCGALEAGHPVAVGLEMPVTLDEALGAYLGSDGDREDVESLLAASRFWTREYQDGRASRDILALVEELRRWAAAGLPVSVFAFDAARALPGPGAREEEMARHLNAAIEDAGEDALVFALTGNLHARMAGGFPWDPRMSTMGELAEAALPGRRWIALNATSQGGTAWTCTGSEAESCGSRRVGGTGPRPRGLDIGPRGKGVAYNGTFHVGPVTSSPPAAESLEEGEGGG